MSWMKPLCLASRHNAQQGIGVVDHHVLRGLAIGLQGVLFVVVLAHEGSIRFAHYLLHHLLGHTNRVLQNLWLGSASGSAA